MPDTTPPQRADWERSLQGFLVARNAEEQIKSHAIIRRVRPKRVRHLKLAS